MSRFPTPDNPLPAGLTQAQVVMAEEVLHRFPEAKILPSLNFEGTLPDTHQMIPVYHVGEEGCKRIAFYYTHVLDRAGNEMPIASRAKFPDGSRPDRNQPFICGSCNERINLMSQLRWHGE